MPTEIKPRIKLRYRGLLLLNRIILVLSTAFIAEWSVYGIFRCPFIVPFVSCQNCPVITCPGRAANMFWGFWGFWLAVLLMFGRAFCGWLCPGSLVNRVFALNPLKWKLNLKTISVLSWGKFLGLIFVVFVYFFMHQPRVNLPIRVGEFWQAIPQTFGYATNFWLFRSWFVISVFLLGLFIAQAWCRYACPMGGLLEIFKRFSLFKVYKTRACIDCDKCRDVCYMQTRPEEVNCTNCGDCLQVCPVNCIGLGRPPQPGVNEDKKNARKKDSQ